MPRSMLKFLTGFEFAWRGVSHVFRTQRNARVQLAVGILVAIAGFVFGISQSEWIAILLCVTIVLAAEAINTALECLADAVHPGRHPLVGKAKDAAAGAVLLCAIGAALVGLIIFLPYLGIRF